VGIQYNQWALKTLGRKGSQDGISKGKKNHSSVKKIIA